MTTKKLTVKVSGMTQKTESKAADALGTIQTKTPKEMRQAEGKEKLEKFMKEELRTVRGVFQNFETPGTSATVTVQKYPGHKFQKAMMDQVEYEVPLYIARFLNGIDVTAEKIGGKLGTCSYPINTHIMDVNGNPIVSQEKRKRRYGFQSMEFGGSTNSVNADMFK
jgi:hypothetical protein